MLLDVFLALWLSLAMSTFLYTLYVLYKAVVFYQKVHSSKVSFNVSFWIYYVIIIAGVCLVMAPLAFINVSFRKKRLFAELYELIAKHEKLKRDLDE